MDTNTCEKCLEEGSLCRDHQPPAIPVGYARSPFGEDIKMECMSCDNMMDDSDGPEYGPACWVCEAKPHMNNLKGFPFKTPLKCWEMPWQAKVDWTEEARKSDAERAICEHLSHGKCFSYCWQDCESAGQIDEYTRSCKKALPEEA